MTRLLRGLLLAALLAYPCARLAAHVRLVHPYNGSELAWSSPGRVEVVLQERGSDDLAPSAHLAPLRLALAEWSAVPGSAARLVEDDSAASRARTDWEARDLHLVWFDEHDDSGWFPAGSAVVALTPVWFAANGAILDADVLFNGAGFRFGNGSDPGFFDLQDVAAHELGHLLGLDHSGAAGATLFPYVDQGVLLQRSLSADERAGLADAYPSGTSATITGRVERHENGRGVAGAYVVARDADGRLAASILADEHGEFRLRGLAAGTFTLYARPLDAPVGASNLGPAWSGKIETDFEAALHPAPVVLAPGGRADVGVIVVDGDVALTLGSAVDRFPLRVVAGATQTVYLHGSGLFAGSTLVASDPDLVLGLPLWQGAQVSFALTVPAGEAPGHVDLAVTNAAGRMSILPAALEVTPPSPVVRTVEPASGSLEGGDELVLRGEGFGPLVRVVIGENVYTAGIEVEVLDEGTLRLTTAATRSGAHDVVVIDPSGVEGRAREAFRVLSTPALAQVLPRAGAAEGGTEVWLAGNGFAPGVRVRIDGVDQGSVTLEGPDLARFTTLGGAAGGPYALELENPDGGRIQQAFAYVDRPDPRLDALTPASGPARGGSVLTLRGANFTPATSVAFLADPAAAPRAAEEVRFVDEHTLEVVTPAHPRGEVSVLVTDAGEAGVLAEGSFAFTGEGGGGGGCAGLSAPDSGGPHAWLGAWWALAVLLVLAWRARGPRHAVV